MKVWKIVSGILSIIISPFVVFQSFFAGAYNILTGNGQSSGTVGVLVAIMLLSGGIVAIATYNGSRGGDIAMVFLYLLGALIGFFGAGSYTDLYIWSFWGLLCVVLAMVDFVRLSRYDYDDEEEEEDAQAPVSVSSSAPARSAPIAFQDVILETDPRRRDAAIDALPEREAKSYLKQALNVLVPHHAAGDLDDDGGVIRALAAALVVLGCLIVAIIAVGVFTSSSGRRGTAASASPAASGEVQESEPAQSANQPEGGSYGIGDHAVNDGITVTLLSVSESQGADFLTPSEGNVFVLCEFDIENDSERDIAVSSILSFSAYVDDYATNISISAMSSSDQPQLDGSVAAGKKMNGVIGYEVSSDWSEIEIRFSADFWGGDETIFLYSKG